MDAIFQDSEIRFAVQVVRKASQLAKKIQMELVNTAVIKEDLSPVTVADFAVQALIAKELMDHFPLDHLIGEENSADLLQDGDTLARVTSYLETQFPGTDSSQVASWIDRGQTEGGERFWVLDPVDGTKGFLRGGQYAVAFALVEGGVVKIGVLGCPNLAEAYREDPDGRGSLILAVRGGGAWLGQVDGEDVFKPLRVADVKNPQGARILRSYEGGHTNVSQTDRFAESMNVAVESVLMDSQAKYAVMASGHGDILLRLISEAKPNYKEKIWDQAAGSIVIEEAGGRVTDLDGKPLDFSTGRRLVRNRGILATNAYLHEAALRVLREIGA
jgi:3'(2'), 5'-bisphosphate nucleotidase